jgi:hypothetical protein
MKPEVRVVGDFPRPFRAILALATVLVAFGGCGGTSDSATTSGDRVTGGTDAAATVQGESAKDLAEPLRRKLHGTAELMTPDVHRLGVATLGPGSSVSTRTLRLHVRGLRSTGRSNYTVWLSAAPQQMLMLGSFTVGSGGVLPSKVEFPSILTRNLEHGAYLQLVLTRTNRARLQAALSRLPSRNEYSPYTGTAIARGQVLGPIIGARPNISSITR